MIMAASSTELVGDIPKISLLPAVTMIMVPLVWIGMKALVRFQSLTFVLYVVLMLAAFWVSLRAGGEFDWLRHQPDQPAPFWPSLLTSISIMNGMVFACVLVIPDYARFVRRTERKAARRWVGDRKGGVEGKSVSVRLDLGGRRLIQKKNIKNTIT